MCSKKTCLLPWTGRFDPSTDPPYYGSFAIVCCHHAPDKRTPRRWAGVKSHLMPGKSRLFKERRNALDALVINLQHAAGESEQPSWMKRACGRLHALEHLQFMSSLSSAITLTYAVSSYPHVCNDLRRLNSHSNEFFFLSLRLQFFVISSGRAARSRPLIIKTSSIINTSSYF